MHAALQGPSNQARSHVANAAPPMLSPSMPSIPRARAADQGRFGGGASPLPDACSEMRAEAERTRLRATGPISMVGVPRAESSFAGGIALQLCPLVRPLQSIYTSGV